MAGNRIRGITIEIDGNTAKLQDALNKVNKTIGGTKSALSDVEKLLELDPGNVQLLEQKQNLLAAAVESTREKLRQEKEALEQLKTGDQTAETVRQQEALTREIVETEQSLKSLETQFKEFGSVAAQQIAAAGEKVRDVGGKIEDAGRAVAPLSAAVTAGFGAAVKVTADFDAAMSQVAATMGTTTDQIGDLRQFAKKMGAETAFSATEAAEALNYMALAGYDAETSMEMLPTVLNLAAAGGIGLASASGMVTDASSALGLSLDETAELADKMAQASSKSGTSVAQLGEAILTVGGTAKTLAGGTTELSTALGILADNGVKGAQGGTALRNIILSLAAPTDKAASTMEALGLSAYDAQGNLRPLNEIFRDFDGVLSAMTQGEQTEVLNNIFNKVDLKSVNALLSNTGERFDELSGYIDKAQGSAQAMADTQLDNLNGEATLLKSALEGLAISAGEILMPVARDMVEKVQQAVDWLNSLDDGTKKNIVTVGLAVAALGPALIVAGKTAGALGTLMAFAPQIMGAVSGASALITGTAIPAAGAMLTAIGPFLPMLAAVAAAIAAVIVVIKNWDAIVAALKKTFADVVEAIRKAVEKIKGILNFKFELPKLKLPHLKITGELSLMPPSVPKVSVDWFRKAYGEAYLLQSPAIFGASGGHLLGGGDGPGPEAVVGTEKLMDMMRQVLEGSGAQAVPIVLNVDVGGQFFDRRVVQAVRSSNYRSGGR